MFCSFSYTPRNTSPNLIIYVDYSVYTFVVICVGEHSTYIRQVLGNVPLLFRVLNVHIATIKLLMFLSVSVECCVLGLFIP